MLVVCLPSWFQALAGGQNTFMTLLILTGFVIGFSRSPELGWQLVFIWVVINGGLAALGALLARGHPLTVLSALVAAPLTSLNPTIAAGIGVTMFFCFMYSWVELLLAKTLTSVEAKPIAATMTRTASSSGYELGLLAAAGSLTIVPGAIVIYFVRNYIAKGFALGRV